MTTVLSIVIDALQEINVIDEYETPDAADSAKALRKLNDMLDAWSLDNLTVAVQNNYTYTLIPGQAVYTIGPAGTFVGVRLNTIASAFVRYQLIDFPVVLIDNQTYNDIPFKTQAGILPQAFTLDQTMPASTVTLWPVPQQAIPITFLSNVPSSTPVTLATDLIYAPGYNRAIVYNLAVELCNAFDKQPSDLLMRLAASSLGTLKRQNKRTPLLQYDDAMYDTPVNGAFNWLY